MQADSRGSKTAGSTRRVQSWRVAMPAQPPVEEALLTNSVVSLKQTGKRDLGRDMEASLCSNWAMQVEEVLELGR